MKRTLLLTVLVLSAAAISALPFSGNDRGAGYVPAEVKALEEEFGPRFLSEIKVSDLAPAARRLDVAFQKDRYVMLAGGLSLAWPGAGQFLTGDWAGGTLQTGLHLGIVAGTLGWAHSLLPADLRWENLDYVNSKKETLEAAWKTHAASEFFPAFGALAAGGAVELALRFWSAKDAQTRAKAQIDDGRVTFEPLFDGRRFGLGIRF